MKKIFILFLAAAGLCSSITFLPFTQAPEDIRDAHVFVYYFHGAARCLTCHKLEKYSRESIEANFKDRLASGSLEFKVVNIEDKGNEHYAKDYQLYSQSLILSLVKGGEQIKWRNLDKIWEYAGNKKAFINYVKNGLADFLTEAK